MDMVRADGSVIANELASRYKSRMALQASCRRSRR